MLNIKNHIILFLGLFLLTTPLAAQDPLSDAMSALGQAGDSGSVIDLQVLNYGSTDGNDAIGTDLFNTGETLAVTLFNDTLIGFGADAAVSLDATGLEALFQALGLADDTLAASIRAMLGREGVMVAPLVGVSSEIAGLLMEGGLDPSLALGLPGFGDPAIDVAVWGGDNSGQGSVLGVAVLSGHNSGTSDVAGVAILSGNDSGRGGIAGVAILSGIDSGQSGNLGISVLSDAGSGTGDNIGGVSILTPGASERVASGPINVGVLNPNPTGPAEEPSTAPDSGSELTQTGSRLALDQLAALCPGGGCQLVEGTPMILRGVHFEFDTARLTQESLPILDRAAEIIKGQPDVLITVDGHTDAIGTESYNQRLSERRARAVWHYLVEEADVAANRVTYRGLGKTDPIAPNSLEDGSDSPDGRELNRRVALNAVDATTFAQIEERRQLQVGQL